jgi:hypothetical protein
MNLKKTVQNAFDEYMFMNMAREYDAEIWEYDQSTNQLFLNIVGDFSDEDRKHMQDHIRKYVEKILINSMVNYDEISLQQI